jgi:hypothetical protein
MKLGAAVILHDLGATFDYKEGNCGRKGVTV